MLINSLLNFKGRQVFTVAPEDSLSSVTALLYARKVGAFVVSDRVGRVSGIVSERDIVRALAEYGHDALSMTVAEVMSRDVVYANIDEKVDALLARMTDRRIRHLPVMDGANLVGIVSIGDLVKAKIADVEHEAESLKAYILAG